MINSNDLKSIRGPDGLWGSGDPFGSITRLLHQRVSGKEAAMSTDGGHVGGSNGVAHDKVGHALEIAYSTVYGLSGSVWSIDGAAAVAVARRFRTAMFAVNRGFGNGHHVPPGRVEQSSFGRASVTEVSEELLETKAVTVGV